MKNVQANEITVAQAIDQAPAAAQKLLAMAQAHRARHTRINQHQTIRFWDDSAGTYCYQTHIAIAGQSVEQLAWLTQVMFDAASLPSQPWYPQFGGGAIMSPNEPCKPEISHHHLTVGQFDLGLRVPRYYRQLLSLAPTMEHSAAIVARSVNEGPSMPQDATLAYTLDPNGEVLHWENDCLHWHHVCCTPGPALLPGAWDRRLINTLRYLRLDHAERNTYRQEAEQMRDWLQTASPAQCIDEGV